jgi:hypothetical protein
VFAIDGKKLHAVFTHLPHYQFASGHQGLLVGQGNVLSRFNGRQRRLETREPDQRADNQVDILPSYDIDQSFFADQYFRGIPNGLAQGVGIPLLEDGNTPGLEVTDLLPQQLDVPMCCQVGYFEQVRESGDDFKTIAADGTCGTEDGDVFGLLHELSGYAEKLPIKVRKSWVFRKETNRWWLS